MQEELRNEKGILNTMIGGCAAGTVVGAHSRSLGGAAGGCLAMAFAAAIADLADNSMQQRTDRDWKKIYGVSKAE